MFGGYTTGEIRYATIPIIIGGPGEENEVFVMAGGPLEKGDVGIRSISGSADMQSFNGDGPSYT